MTTAHRPTFDPAQGKETRKGPQYHQRLLPAHTVLKVRKPGQGGDADAKRDLRAELLKAEAAHYAKVRGETSSNTRDDDDLTTATATTRKIEDRRRDSDDEDEDETPEAKRRRILEESRDLDADSDGSGGSDGSGSSSEEDSDDEDSEDETAELMRELEKIKRERAEAKEKEERERAAEEEAQREVDIARGNPLLNPKSFNVKRRWDDDVIFKNQARGVQEKGKKKEFVNDLLRSDFHRKFMNKYVR
ncbi:complexed with cef1p [Orbilia brochopaga]|uniref:Complexed with cef1p n=1 Tax=Orbilia brochopaga TaxID=3140254 RepID=A0AAV9UJ15_9PEZI